MTAADHTRWLEILFIVLAVAGFAGTAAQLPPYLAAGSIVEGNVRFWQETVATPAATFIVVDIFVLGAAVLAWMFGECRRLGLSPLWAWGYFLGSALIGISTFMPLFFAHRQRRLRRLHPEQASVPAGGDLVGVAILLAIVAAAVVYSFGHIPAAR